MNSDSDAQTRRRGPYRSKKRLPRQTAFSRKRKLIADDSRENTETDELIVSGEPSSTSRNPESYECSVDRPLSHTAMDCSILTTPSPQLSDNDTADTDFQNPLKLYEDSVLSTEESRILISSYMCRHNLTGQAREDLLKLLQLHLPLNNQLSSSLYTFTKYSDHTRDIVPDYHYYCCVCYSLLPSSETTQCPNESCNATISTGEINFFITVPVADQLKNLLSSKHALILLIYIITLVQDKAFTMH